MAARVASWHGVVRGPLGGHPMFAFVWTCPHAHKTKKAASQCADRELKRRKAEAKL